MLLHQIWYIRSSTRILEDEKREKSMAWSMFGLLFLSPLTMFTNDDAFIKVVSSCRHVMWRQSQHALQWLKSRWRSYMSSLLPSQNPKAIYVYTYDFELYILYFELDITLFFSYLALSYNFFCQFSITSRVHWSIPKFIT